MELFNNVKKNLHYIVWEVIPNQSGVSLQVVERWTEGGLKEEKVEDTRLVVEEEEEKVEATVLLNTTGENRASKGFFWPEKFK